MIQSILHCTKVWTRSSILHTEQVVVVMVSVPIHHTTLDEGTIHIPLHTVIGNGEGWWWREGGETKGVMSPKWELQLSEADPQRAGIDCYTSHCERSVGLNTVHYAHNQLPLAGGERSRFATLDWLIIATWLFRETTEQNDVRVCKVFWDYLNLERGVWCHL